MKPNATGIEWPNANASNPSSVLPHAEMLWLTDKLRPVERHVKRWSKKSGTTAFREHEMGPNYSYFINLHPQSINDFSGAFALLIRRFLATNPQANPQIFRAFSASFAHAVVRLFFRSLCAAISQELANSSGKKNGETKANHRSCGKRFTVRRSRFAVRFSAATWCRHVGVRTFSDDRLPVIADYKA